MYMISGDLIFKEVSSYYSPSTPFFFFLSPMVEQSDRVSNNIHKKKVLILKKLKWIIVKPAY